MNEIDLLASIFPDNVVQASESCVSVLLGSVKCTIDFSAAPFQLDFSSNLPNMYQIWQQIQDYLEEQNLGSPIEYTTQLIQLVNEQVEKSGEQQLAPASNTAAKKLVKKRKVPTPVRYNHSNKALEYPSKIFTTEPFTTNKSTFVTLGVFVKTKQEVDAFIDFVNESQQFADATHNMAVWRLANDEGVDEDGEDGAGSRMLFLMQKQNVVGKCIIVSRFWGGVLLGPVRFKIICQQLAEMVKHMDE